MVGSLGPTSSSLLKKCHVRHMAIKGIATCAVS